MGRGLTLQTLYEVARVTVPSYLEAWRGPLPRERVDARVHELARRIVERARIRLTVHGREQVPLDRAYVYMSNHQSHMDIPILFHTLPSQTVRMVAKTELFRLPVFGRAMTAGGIIRLDRSNREAAVASLREAGEHIRSGVSVWIAPEGTRARDGLLKPLKKGGFHLARDTGTPIVPVALSGTRAILPPKTTSMAYDVPVEVHIGAPIATAGRDIGELMAEVDAFLHAHVHTSQRRVA